MCGPAPVGRAREIRRLIQGSSPKTCFETISGGEEVLEGKGVACFWATSLEKIFGGTTTLAAAKGRLIRCTVPGSPPNCLAMTRTPGRQEPPGPTSTRCAICALPSCAALHPVDSNYERIRSEHFLDFMKQRHSPLLRSGPPV